MVPVAEQKVETELVPLRVAASVAYFHITEAVRQVSRAEDLDEVLHLVAIALSTVAPIRRADGSALSESELHERFYSQLGKPHAGKPDLGDLVIRRADLKNAMTTLREARVVFDPRR
jgi:hypothetical protein